MAKFKVTVIVPCYNVELYLHRCMESIVNQSFGFENLEVILVDDKSTDRTAEIIKEYEKKYPENVVAVYNEQNTRVGGARNRGLDLAKGEYVMFVDSDDYIDSSMIEKMYTKALEHNVDMVQSDMRYVSGDGEQSRISGNDVCLNLEEEIVRKNYILNHYHIEAWARLIKKEVIDKYNIRFCENVFCEDVHFTGLLLFILKSVYYLREELYFYYNNPQSIIHGNFDRTRTDSFWGLEEKFESDLKTIGLWDTIQNIFYREYEFFIASKWYLDTTYQIETHEGNRLEENRDRIYAKCPDVMDNYYLTSLKFPDNRRKLLDLKKHITTCQEYNYMDNNFIHVCFAINDRSGSYCNYLGTVILSIIKNTNSKVCFHVLHDDTLTVDNRQKLNAIVEDTYSIVVYHKVDLSDWDFSGNEWINHYSMGSLYRLLIPDVLQNLDKVLYLDADLMFNTDIEELWNINIGDYSLAGVHDVGFEHGMRLAVPIRKGIVPRENYINSGVLIMNLNKIRRKGNLAELFIEYFNLNPEIEMPDQDALNEIFVNDILLIDEKWNTTTRYERMKETELRNVVYHYMGEQCIRFSKPTKYDRLYLKTRAETPWGYDVIESEIFRGLYSAYDKIDQLQKIIFAISETNKTRIFVGMNTIAMQNLTKIVPIRDGDYYVGNDPIVGMNGKRFGIPEKTIEQLLCQEKGSFVAFVLPEYENIMGVLDNNGFQNGVDYFVVPRCLTADQGGYIW